MPENTTPSQGQDFALRAQTTAEDIKQSETTLAAEKLHLAEDMVRVKDGLIEANRKLPGVLGCVTSEDPRGRLYYDRKDAERYRSTSQVVILAEPTRSTSEGQEIITYIAATPDGFKGIVFNGDQDPRLQQFQ